MHITALHLVNFKRFTDLTIRTVAVPNTPDSKPPTLVLLIGSNGSGKTSVFDAFEAVSSLAHSVTRPSELVPTVNAETYYRKVHSEDFSVTIALDSGASIVRTSQVLTSQTIGNTLPTATTFYGRTALRQIPMLNRTYIGKGAKKIHPNDTGNDRPRLYIDRDERFENDIEKITERALLGLFRGEKTEDLLGSLVEPINAAFVRVFGNQPETALRLLSLVPPLEGNVAQILFQKGTSTVHYNLLSTGEKEVFNILLNLHSRRADYQDTIYYLDELDLHLNTKLQKALLQEIVEHWIPNGCQLWTASHSLGFIEYANESEEAVILDFDDLNFDLPQVLTPKPKNTYEVFEVAVSKESVAQMLNAVRFIFVEGDDDALYNQLALRGTVFTGKLNKEGVIRKLSHYPNGYGLIDRDFLSDTERKELTERQPNLAILELYSVENYLYHPDNLEEYYHSVVGRPFNKELYIEHLLACKETHLIDMEVKAARKSYPFFKDIHKLLIDDEKRRKRFEESEDVRNMLRSKDFAVFYSVFPMKSYCTELSERQNLKPIALAQTSWFKQHILHSIHHLLAT